MSLTTYLKALSLHCYACQKANAPSACLFSSECSASERHCVAIYNETSDHKPSISKQCAEKCPEIKETGVKVVCCEDSYCNGKGAVSMKTSYAILIVAMLASFLYILPMEL
uniref:Lymphocyte antigen 6E-like n=1 Tax=Pogona vitticeps TaxID=103695 RepID=A0ABM5GDE1_9SAUR